MTTLNIESILPWSAEKVVDTKLGKRRLRTAAPNEQFSALWKSDKEALRSAGISWSKNQQGEWQVCWWLPVSVEMAAKENEAIAASKATDADIEIPCPDGLAYMGFQKAGIKFLSERPATLLADQMGLGKTVQVIGLINLDATIKKILIVCPASLKINWRNELSRWLTRPLKVGVQNAGEPWIGDLVDVVILNYDILAKFQQIYQRDWDLLAADEAHYVKSRNAKRTKLLLGAAKKADKAEFPGVKAKRRVMMSGTPILNKPIEIFPLLESLEPGKWTFRDKVRYCNGHEGRWGWDFTGAAHLDELQRRLRSSVMCRRLKKEVLTELPPKRRQVIEISANGDSNLVREEAASFARHEDEIAGYKVAAEVARLADDEEAYKDAVAKLNGAYTVAFTEIAKMRHAIAVAKAPKVAEHIENILEDTGKVVVFCHHHDVTDTLAAALSDYGVLVIDGRTENDERQGIVDQFNTQDTRVLLLGIRAAGVGLSVKASVEVFAELDWTPGVIQQAEDRCHGVGRGIEGEPLLVQHLVLEASLDARMAKALVAKQDVADRALDKGAGLAVGSEPVLTITVGSVLDASESDSEPSSGTKPRPGDQSSPRMILGTKTTLPASDALRDCVHAGLRRLAGVCDGAHNIDGAGFNKFDSQFGKALAERSYLTDKMISVGIKLCTKYRRQLGEQFTEQLTKLKGEQK